MGNVLSIRNFLKINGQKEICRSLYGLPMEAGEENKHYVNVLSDKIKRGKGMQGL